MWKSSPTCTECDTEITPYNLFGLCSGCYENTHCPDCDMLLDTPKVPCTLCNNEDLNKEGA